MLLDSSKDKAVTMKCTVLSALKILDVKTTYGLAVAAAFRCTSNVSTKNKISKPCIYSTGNVLSATFSIISLCLNIIVSAANILILN